MSTMEITTKITYKYLMGKSKHDLAYMILDLLDKVDDESEIDYFGEKCLCPADGHSELCPIHKINSSPR